MGNYSKSKLKIKGWLKILIVLFVIVLILAGAFLTYVLFNNNIVYERISDVSSNASDDEATNSTPILIDNLIVGAVYDKKWISSEKYYFKSKNKSEVEIDIYNAKGKAGKFILNSIDKSKVNSAIYAKTTNTNTIDEYLAIATGDTDIMPNPASKVKNITEADIETAKKALGFRKIFNSSVKITEIYEAKIDGNAYSRIMFVTNETGKSTGAYSAVIYEDSTGKTKCIKYNYIRDFKDASNWPIYSFKFVADLNKDGTNELIIQETKEFDVKYDILEYKNNNFKEILSSTMKQK